MTRWIKLSLSQQRLELLDGREVVSHYLVSTSRNGPGERISTGRTPRGDHVVHAKIGAGCAEGTVFEGRRSTGERCGPELLRAHPGRDWILTRILWLGGLEVGRNRLGDVDTMRRTIYIHGCPDEVPVGTPGSSGCIRMRNADVIELFDRVEVGTLVRIEE
jgi:hypothetical protein